MFTILKVKNQLRIGLLAVLPFLLNISYAKDNQENELHTLKGKAVFQHYGIDESLPKLAMSSLMQGEHLVEFATRKIEIGDDVKESHVYLVKDTDTKGNIDLRIKYRPDQIADHENVVDEIETFTRREYRLRNYAESFDKSSVKATELSGHQVLVTFDYSKYGLPQDISYFRFLSVKLFVEHGKPTQMVIYNKKPFTFDNYKVENYRQTIDFKHLASGKIILARKHTEATGTSKKKPLKVTIDVTPVAIYDDEEGVNILDHDKLDDVSDPRMREQRVELHRLFPLMGDMVRRQGIDLPLPFGVSIAYRNQDMNIPFNDFTIDGIRLNDFFDPADTIGVVNAQSLTLRGDVNILPFWNVFGYVGQIDVDAQVDAAYTGKAGQIIKEKLNNKFPHLGDAFCKELSAICQPGNLNVPLHLQYDLAGIGTTLSVGYREFFASVTGTYSITRMKGTDRWGDGIVTVQPMLGYQLADYRAQLFVGAEYQGLDSRMDGRVVSGNIAFDYDIGVELNQWAYLVGFNKQFGKNYNLSVLYNKGETREAFTINFGYRF
ncbi:hypothetical protein [Shewanella maritima]|uniref:hypothetical protein n=1 Tax=Shewanella maritima TaxID=2520507 RepID=UPI003734D1DC